MVFRIVFQVASLIFGVSVKTTSNRIFTLTPNFKIKISSSFYTDPEYS